MEKSILESIGQYSAYALIVGYSFFKIIAASYNYLKTFFFSKKEKKEGVTVNVTNTDINTIKDDHHYSLYFLLEQGKILKMMDSLHSDVLKEQMDYFDKHVRNFRMIITNLLIDLLPTLKLNENDYNTYFNNFENFVEVCEYTIKDVFRQMCKVNHFAEYSSSDFRDLVIKNKLIIIGTIDELIRKRYSQKDFVSYFSGEYIKILQNSIQSCFEYARDVSFEREQKIKNIKEEFEKKVSDLIGIKYSI